MIVLVEVHEVEGPFHRSENEHSDSTSQRFYKEWFKKKVHKESMKSLNGRDGDRSER